MSKKLQVVHTAELAVTFDPNICMHSGVCIRGLPAVFDGSRADWIHPGAAPAEAVQALVARCPSGALQSVRAGHPPAKLAAGSAATVVFTSDGPALIRGTLDLELPTGTKLRRDGPVAFCRCGQTKNDPYCDGSHGRAGFRSPR
ncbi:MAG: (4Fe-4S)-binding protein [Gemmatimonadales bacterium]